MLASVPSHISCMHSSDTAPTYFKKKLNITVFAHNKNKMQESLIIILLVFKLPQILIRNGLLKKIVVAHDMRKVYEHGG